MKAYQKFMNVFLCDILTFFFIVFCLQHNIRGGEAPAEGEEQDGNEETGHCFLGLRRVR